MSVQILLTALERIEKHEAGEHIAKHDSCEECRHMIGIAEKALAKYEAAPDHTVVTCVYCGMEYPDGTPAAKAKILTEHIKVCTSHPMHAVANERDELKRILDQRIENDAQSVQSDSIVASCNCLTKTPDAKHHAKGCKYRLICERDEAISNCEKLIHAFLEGSDSEHGNAIMDAQLFIIQMKGIKS